MIYNIYIMQNICFLYISKILFVLVCLFVLILYRTALGSLRNKLY